MYAHSRKSRANIGRLVKLTAIWSVIAISGGAFGMAAIKMATLAPDPYSLCQSSAIQAAATTTVIVDPTDALMEAQRARVRTTIETERDRLPKGGRLIIVSLNPGTPWDPLEMASVCNPGSAAEADPIFETRGRIEKRWRTAYADPIERAIGQASDGPASPSSPIVVTIAATLLRPDFDARVRRRRLVIISDLLEHQNGGYSQLKGGDLWKAYRGSSIAGIAPLELRGVAVAADYLLRGQYAAVQGEKHREFWRRLFSEAGASKVSFIGMEPAPAQQETSVEQVAKRPGRN